MFSQTSRAKFKGWYNDEPMYEIDGRQFRLSLEVEDVHEKSGREAPQITYESSYFKDRFLDKNLVQVDYYGGKVQIEIDGILGLLLDRLEPEEIAQTLWYHKEIRNELLQRLVRDVGRDSHEMVSKFLALMKSHMIMQHVEGVSEALRSAEYYEKKYWDLYHNGRVNVERPDFLEYEKDEYGQRITPFVKEDPEYKIGSDNWVEARNWWRNAILEACGFEEVSEIVEELQKEAFTSDNLLGKPEDVQEE